MDINSTISVIAIVWSLLTTIAVIYLFLIFKNLIKLIKNKEFINNTKEIKEIKSAFADFEKLSKSNIQKVGLVKYNSFSEVGGGHSFSLALLNGNKSGIIITSLHARDRTRLYVKDVIFGKARLKLSEEENRALQLSLK